MGHRSSYKFQLVHPLPRIFAILMVMFHVQDLWAVQDAMVMVDSAVVFADEQMSSPVGYIRKGRKIKVGDVARNRAQVYPIIVSGKVAYIRVLDVTTEKESVEATNLVAERFQRLTEKKIKSNYTASYFTYSSQVTLQNQNDQLQDKDPVNWQGVSAKGGAEIIVPWDLDIMLNYLSSEVSNEAFRMVEFGFGVANRILDLKRFHVRVLGQLMAVPFASYEIKEEFRVNSYGYSAGAGMSASYRMGKTWGLEAYGGLYYTRLMTFEVPQPYNQVAPAFAGTRLGIGLNYQF